MPPFFNDGTDTILFTYDYFSFLKGSPLTWAYSSLVAPNMDLTYFLTPRAMGTSPLSSR